MLQLNPTQKTDQKPNVKKIFIKHNLKARTIIDAKIHPTENQWLVNT